MTRELCGLIGTRAGFNSAFRMHRPLSVAAVGHNDWIFGPRFPPMTNAYTPALRDIMKSVAAEKGLAARLREGVYVNVAGPSYETRHEIALMRTLGGDAGEWRGCSCDVRRLLSAARQCAFAISVPRCSPACERDSTPPPVQ